MGPRQSQRLPASPGTYKWKMLATPGLKAHFLLNVSNNSPMGSDKTAWGESVLTSRLGPLQLTAQASMSPLARPKISSL